MATFRHLPTGKRFFFAHIPRTAGRFIETNLLVKNDFTWDDDWVKFGIQKMYEVPDGIGIELGHFHRELYEKHLEVEGIPHISVIRNPIDKFFSASTYLFTVYGKEIQQKLEDYDEFVSIIENFPQVETLNWWRPQVEFITDKTHLWEFEDGLGADFGDWMSEKLQVPFKIDENARYPMNRYEGLKLERTPGIVKNIKKFYSEDIDSLYPMLL